MRKSRKIICEECERQANYMSSARKHGHWFCYRCKNKKSWPKLWAKLFPNLSVAKQQGFKKTIKGIRLTSCEAKLLYSKYYHEGMSASAVKYRLDRLRTRVKYSHELEKIRVAAEKEATRKKGIVMPFEKGEK